MGDSLQCAAFVGVGLCGYVKKSRKVRKNGGGMFIILGFILSAIAFLMGDGFQSLLFIFVSGFLWQFFFRILFPRHNGSVE